MGLGVSKVHWTTTFDVVVNEQGAWAKYDLNVSYLLASGDASATYGYLLFSKMQETEGALGAQGAMRNRMRE